MAKAKSKKAKAKKAQSAANGKSIPTSEKLMERLIADVRQQLSKSLSEYLIGRIAKPDWKSYDDWQMNLGDGKQWYRLKPGLSPNKAKKAWLLRKAASDVDFAENEFRKRGSLNPAAIFLYGLRIGGNAQLAKKVIDTDNIGGGQKPKLKAEQVIDIRLARDKGRPVLKLAKDYDVSDDTIYRVLRGEYVPQD